MCDSRGFGFDLVPSKGRLGAVLLCCCCISHDPLKSMAASFAVTFLFRMFCSLLFRGSSKLECQTTSLLNMLLQGFETEN